jgi:hypothetical protein
MRKAQSKKSTLKKLRVRERSASDSGERFFSLASSSLPPAGVFSPPGLAA